MNFSNVTETAASSSSSEQKRSLAFPAKIIKASMDLYQIRDKGQREQTFSKY